MRQAAIIAVCLFFVWLPWLVLLPLLVNRAVQQYRERRRQGRELEPIDRDFVRLCYVTFLIVIALKGW